MKRKSTSSELISLMSGTRVGRGKGMVLVDPGQWTAYIPHFHFSKPFHITNRCYTGRSRLARFNADKNCLEECVDIGEYVALNPLHGNEKSSAKMSVYELFSGVRQAEPEELEFHRYLRLLCVYSYLCEHFITRNIMGAFLSRPTRDSFPSASLEHTGPSLFKTPLLTLLRNKSFQFSADDLDDASTNLHEFRGAIRHSNTSNIEGASGKWLEGSSMRRNMQLPASQTIDDIFITSSDWSSSGLGALNKGEEIGSNLVDFFMG